MKNKHVKFLKNLVETPSPTGSEVPVAELVRERLSIVADEVRTDIMGSVHAAYYGSAHHQVDRSSGVLSTGPVNVVPGMSNPAARSLTLMLAAHMDEVGLMVTYISDDGFLSVSSIGGVDAAILPGMRVDVHTQSGVLRGVVGRKPVHLIDPDERKSVTPLEKLVIDLGMSAKQVKKKVRVGDSITYGVGFERLGRTMAVSRAFDDKVGVFIACRVMENLSCDDSYEGNFVAAVTVQEEIGTRGAMTSAHSICPNVALAFDVTHATDYPGIDKSKYGNIVCGGGPVIARGPNINPAVFERLVRAAEDEGIPYQLEAEPSVTGTDARAIQVSRGGIPTGLVSIPLRYMHTPTEVIDLNDVEGAIALITRFAKDLDTVASFVPGYCEPHVVPDDDDEDDEMSDEVADAQDEAQIESEESDEIDVDTGLDEMKAAEDLEDDMSDLDPQDAPFGRQQGSLSDEFQRLSLDQRTIGHNQAAWGQMGAHETPQAQYQRSQNGNMQGAFEGQSQQQAAFAGQAERSMQGSSAQQHMQHQQPASQRYASQQTQAQQSGQQASPQNAHSAGVQRKPHSQVAVPVVTIDAAAREELDE